MDLVIIISSYSASQLQILIQFFIEDRTLFFFSTKTYVVGTQRSSERENMLKLMGKKILTILMHLQMQCDV